VAAKSTTFAVKTTVVKTPEKYGGTNFNITLEGSGFIGEASGSYLGQAFEAAFEDLMAKVAEGCFEK
jgi:hypothetical protein